MLARTEGRMDRRLFIGVIITAVKGLAPRGQVAQALLSIPTLSKLTQPHARWLLKLRFSTHPDHARPDGGPHGASLVLVHVHRGVDRGVPIVEGLARRGQEAQALLLRLMLLRAPRLGPRAPL
jgi:hypothetical protein